MSDVRVAVAVVGHHSREDMAQRLSDKLGAKLFLDDGRWGEMGNHLRAFEHFAYNTEYTHLCVLEDDAMPVPEFLETLPKIVSERPEDLISLYIGKGAPKPLQEQIGASLRFAERAHLAWLEDVNLMWGVGVVIPIEHIKDLLVARLGGNDYYDNRVGAWWWRTRHRKIQYVYPSLINHNDITPSTIYKNPTPARVAWRTGVRDDYSTKSINLL